MRRAGLAATGTVKLEEPGSRIYLTWTSAPSEHSQQDWLGRRNLPTDQKVGDSNPSEHARTPLAAGIACLSCDRWFLDLSRFCSGGSGESSGPSGASATQRLAPKIERDAFALPSAAHLAAYAGIPPLLGSTQRFCIKWKFAVSIHVPSTELHAV